MSAEFLGPECVACACACWKSTTHNWSQLLLANDEFVGSEVSMEPAACGMQGALQQMRHFSKNFSKTTQEGGEL